jgi:hypothetical protein
MVGVSMSRKSRSSITDRIARVIRDLVRSAAAGPVRRRSR